MTCAFQLSIKIIYLRLYPWDIFTNVSHISNFDFGLELRTWTWAWACEFGYGLGMTQVYQLDHWLPYRFFKCVFDNVLLEHVACWTTLCYPCSSSFCPPGITWDTFLTLRVTQRWYLNHVLSLSDQPSQRLYSPFPLWIWLGLGFWTGNGSRACQFMGLSLSTTSLISSLFIPKLKRL